MIALPLGFIIMLFGGGSSVFVNALIAAVVTTTILWAVRRVQVHDLITRP